MGRKKIESEKKTKTVKVYIPEELYEKLEQKNIKNKSKLFYWLLEQTLVFIALFIYKTKMLFQKPVK
jgi:hypothetical protein